MKILRDWFHVASIVVGTMVIIFWIFGTLGMGHFYIYYGKDPVQCEKVTK